MTTIHMLCLAVGVVIGAIIALFAVGLVAVGKLGDDPLPEIQPERIPQYQD